MMCQSIQKATLQGILLLQDWLIGLRPFLVGLEKSSHHQIKDLIISAQGQHKVPLWERRTKVPVGQSLAAILHSWLTEWRFEFSNEESMVTWKGP